MKKLLSLVLLLSLLLLSFAACAEKKPDPAPGDKTEPGTEEATTIRIAGLKGPTSMGLVKLMEDNANKTAKNSYTFSIAGSADEVTPKLKTGELDMAAIPANLASVLYNNTSGEIQVLAVNTLGVVYLVERGNSVQDYADLRGKTIFATGKGSTPEYALRYLLSQNGIDPDRDVTIEWKSEPTEVVAAMKKGTATVAMLPQPYVTVALGAVEGLRIAIDLCEGWEKLDNGSQFITGVLVARRAFLEKYPNAVKNFLEEYRASTAFINENVEKGAELVEKYGIVSAAVARQAIPYCHITFLAGAEMKAALSGYLTVLYGQNPKAVGNALPGDDFYYAAT